MKRREFIVGLAGPAAMPLAARAQERVRRIGVLMNLPADDPEGQSRNAALLRGLQELGWFDGRNIKRWGADSVDRTRRHATELAALTPDVLGLSNADERSRQRKLSPHFSDFEPMLPVSTVGGSFRLIKGFPELASGTLPDRQTSPNPGVARPSATLGALEFQNCLIWLTCEVHPHEVAPDVTMSAIGTKRTSQPGRMMSALGVKQTSKLRCRSPLLTQSGHSDSTS